MKVIRTVAREIFGLFVDDGSFAVLILAWIAITWLMAFKLLANPECGGLILFCGLGLILLGSTARRSGGSQ